MTENETKSEIKIETANQIKISTDNRGWICAKCGCSCAPHTNACPKCNPETVPYQGPQYVPVPVYPTSPGYPYPWDGTWVTCQAK